MLFYAVYFKILSITQILLRQRNDWIDRNKVWKGEINTIMT